MPGAGPLSAALPDAAVRREYDLSDAEFQRVRRLVSEATGISLSDAKRDLVYSRLSKRLRALAIDSFDGYCDFLEDEAGEFEHFVNAITTNLTAFFREPHHFDYLAATILPELLERNRASRRLRIWSAGCSTGEEPYSIAITVRRVLPELANWDVRILATDLDSNCLARAAAGIYEEARVAGIDRHTLGRWFRRGRGEHEGKVRVQPELAQMIAFRHLNLMQAWPMRGLFDVIFCRNVVIYFDKPTQAALFARYADQITDGGHLFLGHSETLHSISDRFTLIGKTIYRKVN